MRLIDLFSGGGGLSEGFKNEGFNIICHIEKDVNACMTLLTREIYYYLKSNDNLELYNKYISGIIDKTELLKSIPLKDIENIINLEINENNISVIFSKIDKYLNGIDLDGIIGGPPCQAYSTIGRARNDKIKDKDERIYLYKYYMKFLIRYQPKFFIFENVKGLLSYKDVHNNLLLPQIVKEFEENGYNINYKIIKSDDYGVPQKRERLFIFGIRNDININASTFFECLEFYKEEPIHLKELFKDLPNIKSGNTLNIYTKNKPNSFVHEYIRKGNSILTWNVARPVNDLDKQIYTLISEAKRQGISLKYNELPKNLIRHKNITNFLDRFKCIEENGSCHTLVAHISKDGHHYIHYDVKQNRSITVREAARIQTFPDNYYFEKSRTAAFTQIGNAVPVYLSKKMAISIKNIFLEGEKSYE
ncbi:DNA cytosine methyltransferase [Macrococcus armenti]|uniref:DNA cytosine methyltransferase n=1 Tax=Macrococcus armenti TaxID=2875764 RepID=UPI001CCAB348|nr:DNA cytosine methyltransferase [Macrococcus armenti]UBH08053.1 DNA cytosine methyltransferase [Macrococcus armenti]UBH10285.1 DNA cytosine methyltransferase [Macrococcus armenti]